MALRNTLNAARIRRAIVVALIALVVVPIVWQLTFNSGHGTGRSGYGTIFNKQP